MSFADLNSAAFRDALDRHITGNWGDDSAGNEDGCCTNPGPRGCGDCPGCDDWVALAYDGRDDG